MKKFFYCTYISLIAISIFGCANPQPQNTAEDKNRIMRECGCYGCHLDDPLKMRCAG